MNITQEEAKAFVGGGDREYDDGQTANVAGQIAESSNSFDRWKETRDLADRLNTTTAVVRSKDGDETTFDVPLVQESATSEPEGFGKDADTEEE